MKNWCGSWRNMKTGSQFEAEAAENCGPGMMRKKEHFHVIETIIEQMRIQGSQYERESMSIRLMMRLRELPPARMNCRRRGIRCTGSGRNPL